MSDAATVAFALSDVLEGEGITYAITGALALAVHGAPRMTRDADLAVAIEPGGADRLLDALERAGCIFNRERAVAEIARTGWIIVQRGRVAVDVFVAQHPFQDEAMARRVRIDVPGGARWFHSAEDLALNKLILMRGKDLVDLEMLFAAQGPRLDLAYVGRWLDRILPEGDPRRAALADLERRFISRS